MLVGYCLPLSPEGRSGTVPPPPWHYVGDYLAVEYWAAPDAVAALCPRGTEPSEDAGRCLALFSDCQFAASDARELLDPSVSQYKEFMIAIMVQWKGKPAAYCPYIFVDNENALLRGWIQGLPKQMATVSLTRAFGVASRAAPALADGGVFAGTMSWRERRLVEASVTLRQSTDYAPNRQLSRLLGIRQFPGLARDKRDTPALCELVQQRSSAQVLGPVWQGDATLGIFDSPWHEIGALAPMRLGSGYRYTFAMTIDDLTHLSDLA